MKKLTPIAVLAFLFAVVLSSCSPYEEGPAISLRSKAERVANTWRVNYAVDDDGDQTADYDGDVYIFDKDGAAQVNFTEGGFDFEAVGTWAFTNDDQNMRITAEYVVGPLTFEIDETFEILKLKESELWVKDIDDDRLEIHFVD